MICSYRNGRLTVIYRAWDQPDFESVPETDVIVIDEETGIAYQGHYFGGFEHNGYMLGEVEAFLAK